MYKRGGVDNSFMGRYREARVLRFNARQIKKKMRRKLEKQGRKNARRS